jgi:DNA-binding response OmpR family regulator
VTDVQSDPPGEDRRAFLLAAPRRVVEVKAALGALIADPSSVRMRDEFRRRLDATLVRARLHDLTSFADGLQLCLDQLDAIRALALVSRAHLDRFAGLVASLNGRLELDQRSPAEAPPSSPPGDSVVSLPPGVDASAHGIDALTRRAAPRVAALVAGPTPGSVPLRGAAAQVVLGLAPSRIHALLEVLPTDVEVHVVVDREEAVQRAREITAELVVVESGAPFDGAAVLAALRGAAATDFISVVLVAAAQEPVQELRARCPLALEVLPDDVEAEALRAMVQRVLRGGNTLPPPPVTDLREATVDELARALQDEIRRGLVDSVDPASRDARVSLGEGSEILSAAWRAIATIRDLVERRSHGAVRFEVPVSPRGLPGAEVLSVGVDATDDATWVQPGEDPLPGRRALVVDDDPKVTAQFAETLRGAGMTVYTRNDGRAGLEAARALSPDVILTDILMPGMDGFALSRAVRRDILLRHTPVILLSWREDLLVRMRELGAQAQGYLRKEARIEAVIARVRATLRLRTRTLRRIAELPWGAQVRGRVERVGLPSILEGAAGLGDATVTVGDSVSVTEIELRGGRFASATRTLQDGSVVRGEEALARVVATPAARFGVRRSAAGVRRDLDAGIGELLRECARRVAALEDALTGAGLLQVHRAVFDADAARAYAVALPTPMRSLVERLLEGDSPRDLVLRDGVAPTDLEPLLVELARRGAVREVRDRDERDLAALRLSVPDSAVPPPPEPEPPSLAVRSTVGIIPSLPAPAIDDEGTELDLGESLADAVLRQLTHAVGVREVASSLPPPRPSALRASTPAFGTPESFIGHDRSIEPILIVPLAERIFDSHPPPPAPLGMIATEVLHEPEPAPVDAPSLPPLLVEPEPAALPVAEEASPAEEPAPALVEESAPPPAPALVEEPAPAPAPAPTEDPALAPAPALVEEPAPTEDPAPSPTEDSRAAATASTSSDDRTSRAYTRPLQAAPEDAETQDGPGRTLRLVMLVILAALVSYVVVRVLFVRRGDVAPEPSPPLSITGVGPDASAARRDERERVADAGAGYAEPTTWLDGGVLSPGQGLLVVPGARAGSPRVEVVIEHVGRFTAPAVVPLPEQVYRIRFETGRIRSTQFATVRQGWALIRSAPSEQ